MALDMDQLRKVFYEECRENLEVLENQLVSMDPEGVDLETINTIFRAAHSIKGGGATFDLLDISEFTHLMEAFLDEAREGRRQLDHQIIDLLLKGGDCINDMLVAHETGTEHNTVMRTELMAKFEQLLSGEENQEKTPEPPVADIAGITEAVTDDGSSDWLIQFIPHKDIFFSGNDPVRIIKELRELGTYSTVVCEAGALPDLDTIEPEMCFLSWRITLDGTVKQDHINEVFEWVEDECDLIITRQAHDTSLVMPAPLGEPPAETEVKEPNITPTPEPVATIPEPNTVAPPSPVEKPAPKVEKNDRAPAQAKSDTSVSSIRVDIEKVDNLINLVGELVITQSMLTELGTDFTSDKIERLQAGLDQLLQNTKELQESVLNIRMLPISFAFNRFPRLVRDLSGKLGKKVQLNVQGEHTELDKTVLERIADPLVHLVRNAIDHGLEMPEERASNHKSEVGNIELNAYHQGGSIVIEVADDGAGLNKQRIWQKAVDKGILAADSHLDEFSDNYIFNLIFAPGFSTAEQVSDISGRGVGMDVVKRNIEGLGGQIDVVSKAGEGSRFTISLPLTLAILDGQLVKVADQVFVIPLITIIESIQIKSERVKIASGGIELYRLRDENIPIMRLHEEFELGTSGSLAGRLLCFVEAGGNKVGLLLDELLGQQQVVIKSLESNYTKVAGFSGATILGDGSVSLILDIQGIISGYLHREGLERKDNKPYIAA